MVTVSAMMDLGFRRRLVGAYGGHLGCTGFTV